MRSSDLRILDKGAPIWSHWHVPVDETGLRRGFQMENWIGVVEVEVGVVAEREVEECHS